MSTLVSLPHQQEATLPKSNYLNDDYGLKSWLLTLDHKRIAILLLSESRSLSSSSSAARRRR